ncbi:hypothetical protein P7K49_024804 [Saguinus oedipus]|uniref:Uncharacterized protein n=1 Tax=Saguinus oedipus TaxID=9490 RepID=A0ABQ9US67_SAGOE|nr:hypothetical protein P7K49_024804 [Saguinus oedipus]
MSGVIAGLCWGDGSPNLLGLGEEKPVFAPLSRTGDLPIETLGACLPLTPAGRPMVSVAELFPMVGAGLPHTCLQKGCVPSSTVLPHRLDFNGFYTERLERLSAERSQKVVPQVPVPRGPPVPAPRVAVAAQRAGAALPEVGQNRESQKPPGPLGFASALEAAPFLTPSYTLLLLLRLVQGRRHRQGPQAPEEPRPPPPWDALTEKWPRAGSAVWNPCPIPSGAALGRKVTQQTGTPPSPPRAVICPLSSTFSSATNRMWVVTVQLSASALLDGEEGPGCEAGRKVK